MDVTLHIGPHKTGTTAIQAAFSRNARSLRRRGVHYPKCDRRYDAQHRLAFAMKGCKSPVHKDFPVLEDELERLRRAIGVHKRVFLSSEEFFSAPAPAIAALKDALNAQSVTIFAFPRRPDDFLISAYNQKVKTPGNGFFVPIAHFLEHPDRIAPDIDYLRCISNWAEVFGDAAMRLIPFEDGSPLSRIAAHFDVEDLLPDERGNASVPGAVAEVMRLAKSGQMDPARQRRLYKLANGVFAGGAPFFVCQDDRRKIVGAFEAANAALFERFGLKNPYQAEAVQKPPELDPPRTQNVTLQDFVSLLNAVV